MPLDPGGNGLDAPLSIAGPSKDKRKRREDEPRQPLSAKRTRPEELGEDSAQANEECESRPPKKSRAEG
ncbi:hypothetical protein DL765_004171 [Monosporascus sp. GIB2]|nr:hypothetical protein DL765_004171 [Monosporascus sp. GIB2]